VLCHVFGREYSLECYYLDAVALLSIQTERRTQLIDVTSDVHDIVRGQSGLVVTLFVPHTTVGIVVQAAGEGAKEVASDVESALERIVSEDGPWRHTEEGDRNPWSHVRSALTASSITIPLVDGNLVLGDHQAIFLCEFDGPRTRQLHVVVH
jgi:secondary thiamine-phosphate synthase enzyme